MLLDMVISARTSGASDSSGSSVAVNQRTASSMPMPLVTGNTAASFVWQYPQVPPYSAAPGTPLVVLTQKNFRLVIHTLAILHARSIFASVTVTDVADQRFLLRDHHLLRSLKLQDHLCLETKERELKVAGSKANHFMAHLVTGSNPTEVIREAQLAGFTVIDATDADVTDVKLTQGYYRAPTLDPQALAKLLENLLTCRGAESVKNPRTLHWA